MRYLSMLAMLAALLSVGCGFVPAEDQAAVKPAEPARTAAPCCVGCCEAGEATELCAAADDDKAWGTIKGQIVFGGDKLPDPVELKVDKDQDHCLEKGKLYSDEWVINKTNKGVRWVFVWLAPEPGGAVKTLPIHPSLKEIKEKKVEIDQPCCMFVPHALAMREGQVLVAKNSSPKPHNVNCAGHPTKNPARNVIVPPKGQLEYEGFQADDWPISVACNIHGWMKAYVRVFDHPYFAVTDENGAFEIKNAPAGEWRLRVWHDSGWRGGAQGKQGEKITVKGGAVTDLGKLEIKPN
jgi:hypothetical protein